MKKYILIISLSLFVFTSLYSQSVFSILGKSGGKLLQDLTNNKELKAVGKALETAGNTTYEIERIKAQNSKEIRIVHGQDNVQRAYPTEGYTWTNPNTINDYNVRKVERHEYDANEHAIEIARKGWESLENMDFEMALAYFDESLDVKKTYECYLLRISVNFMNKNFDKILVDAGALLNYAVDDEVFALVNFYTCISHIGNQDYDKYLTSRELLTPYLYLFDSGQKAAIHSYSGLAYYYSGNKDLSTIEFRKAVEIDPYSADALTNWSIIFYEEGNYRGALIKVERAIQATDKNQLNNEEFVQKSLLCELYGKKSFFLYLLKDNQQALISINKAINLNPKYGQNYAVRAYIKIEFGLKEAACNDFVQAQQLGLDISSDEKYIDNCLN